MSHKPDWFRDNEILIINANTCGINKDGHEQYIVNPETGIRSNSDINDSLAEACDMIRIGMFNRSDIGYFPESDALEKDIYVPKYHDKGLNEEIQHLISDRNIFELKTLGELKASGIITVSNGHGSPSSDQRIGEIPYIKVSDLRAGSVNINPTNMIPSSLAKQFWRGEESGLKPYDLISPERASKNIGEFCVLMPGQQKVVLTKEVIVIRATELASFSQFYLMWALSLSAVRRQWERIVFMQTNREDVGNRLLEIMIPFPLSNETAERVAEPFKRYYESLENARAAFISSLSDSEFSHHIHLGESV
ncbi:hypothetical protein [Dyadobacter diqingensis]|uniref:hypothetical protein n=1 Tax=Dyadobacter diqingensis TaxID=2938121 RepID=UPI0020C1B92B|nr:hypothetical protein [Dyadobacter diqingensis]